MALEVLEVDAVSTPDDWTLGAGANKVVAVNSPSDDLSSYIFAAGANVYQQYTLEASAIPPGSTINSVSVFSRMQRGGAANTIARVLLYLGANSSSSADYTLGPAWADRTEPLARPGGGAWAVADLADLEVACRTRTSANQANCTSLWVIVDYTIVPPTDTGKMFLLFP